MMQEKNYTHKNILNISLTFFPAASGRIENLLEYKHNWANNIPYNLLTAW